MLGKGYLTLALGNAMATTHACHAQPRRHAKAVAATANSIRSSQMCEGDCVPLRQTPETHIKTSTLAGKIEWLAPQTQLFALG